ncbi:hypothetical protein B9Z55_017490 [Caenorhabditis nigoni]|uniref:NR LBD domain-containing protein n=1 Tax=Caenorhabditis nigoni TaxID=1611254 RepID=A0A2G5T9Y3_9PELO|nr:hypothetical protein B9Z55_017490 [Caenorhabditis nigoni]
MNRCFIHDATVSDDTRFCQGCRFEKCLNAGMIYKGIEKPLDLPDSDTPAPIPKLQDLLNIQNNQWALHEKYAQCRTFPEPAGSFKIDEKLYRRADQSDINLCLHIGFRNANNWANLFESFKTLKSRDKKSVMGEFGIAFLLVDQAYKSASITDCKSFWFLPNHTFLCSESQERNQSKFVNSLIQSLKVPFSNLQIDDVECVILKALLLFSPSFPRHPKIQQSSGIVQKFMSHLMSYSVEKCPENGEIRFGEVILLLSSIRCAVKSFYNQTRQCGNFNIDSFDNFLRNCFLT